MPMAFSIVPVLQTTTGMVHLAFSTLVHHVKTYFVDKTNIALWLGIVLNVDVMPASLAQIVVNNLATKNVD